MKDYGVSGQIDLEKTSDEYLERLVGVFHEVWWVIRDDGTLWLNLEDTYCGGGRDCGVKPKELVGISWCVAFALRQSGWYLRSDIS